MTFIDEEVPEPEGEEAHRFEEELRPYLLGNGTGSDVLGTFSPARTALTLGKKPILSMIENTPWTDDMHLWERSFPEEHPRLEAEIPTVVPLGIWTGRLRNSMWDVVFNSWAYLGTCQILLYLIPRVGEEEGEGVKRKMESRVGYLFPISSELSSRPEFEGWTHFVACQRPSGINTSVDSAPPAYPPGIIYLVLRVETADAGVPASRWTSNRRPALTMKEFAGVKSVQQPIRLESSLKYWLHEGMRAHRDGTKDDVATEIHGTNILSWGEYKGKTYEVVYAAHPEYVMEVSTNKDKEFHVSFPLASRFVGFCDQLRMSMTRSLKDYVQMGGSGTYERRRATGEVSEMVSRVIALTKVLDQPKPTVHEG